MSADRLLHSVLFASPSYPQYEADWKSVFVRRLLDALAARRDVQIDAWLPRGPMPGSVRYIATSREADWLDGLMQAGGIANVLRKGGPIQKVSTPIQLVRLLGDMYSRISSGTIVHANWLQTALPLWKGRNPLLCSALGTDMSLLDRPGVEHALRFVFRKRRTILAPNADWMRPTLEKHFGDCASIRTIRFGVDDSWYGTKRVSIPTDGLRWLVVSRVTGAKIGPLFEWFRQAAPRQSVLDLIGPMQEGLPVPEWVDYHGPMDARALRTQWFPRAAALISLSRHAEGLPQVMLEAMASGLPVIATDIPAHREVIEDGSTGFLVNSADEFKAAMDSLMNSDRRQHVGEAARSTIRTQFGTWAECAERYVAAYKYLEDLG